MNLGSKISQIRKDNNMSQEEFAKIFNVTRQTVSSWENAKSYPDIETLTKISDRFKISLDVLLKEDEKMIKQIDKKVKGHKKYKIVLIILIILILIATYFVYKGFNMLRYPSIGVNEKEYREFIRGLDIKDTVTIKTDKLDESEYLNFYDIKIKNDFDSFTPDMSSNDINSMVIYKFKDNDKIKAAFWMGTSYTYVQRLTDKTNLDNRFTKKEITQFLNKHKIKNDLDLFRFVKNQKYYKNTIFTSIKNIKNNGILTYIYESIPKVEYLSLIKGDYEGYIFDFGKTKQINILKNDKLYYFTFVYTDYFTDKYIQELLNTIVIE